MSVVALWLIARAAQFCFDSHHGSDFFSPECRWVNLLLLAKHSRRDLSTYAVLCLAWIQSAAAAASVVASASASAEKPALLGRIAAAATCTSNFTAD